jgi:hypothetical protein
MTPTYLVIDWAIAILAPILGLLLLTIIGIELAAFCGDRRRDVDHDGIAPARLYGHDRR